MKELILITGSNGLLSKQLVKHLEDDYRIRFLTRKPKKENEYLWNLKENVLDINALEEVDHIIHLAGANVFEKRWTKARKKSILDSRIDGANLILESLIKNNIKIKTLISASASGYYGTQTTNNIYSETSKRGNDFLSNVCYKWEQVAQQFSEKQVSERTIILRFGIILAKEGGALKKMLTPIKYYLASVLGKGDQYMPWIHIADLCEMIKYSIETIAIKGTYNAVAPEHVTNKKFTETLATSINRTVIFPNIPSFALKLMLGEMSILILKGSRLSSDKIIDTGFRFKFETLKNAIENLINKNSNIKY